MRTEPENNVSEEKTRKTEHPVFQRRWFKRRYLWKDKNGRVIETPEQMFHRVANTIAEVEIMYGATSPQIKSLAESFYNLMVNGIFLPNSPTLMNAGRPNGVLSACFVLPVPDSIEEIFETVKNTAVIQKAGGGTGFDFSCLRPTGDIVSSSGGKTSGPISFWRVIAETTNAIQQGAFRRGANMGVMSIEHPDILRFIHAKQNLSDFTNFNISVKVTNTFMKTLTENPNALHVVTNPRTGDRYVIPRSVDINTYDINGLLTEDQATDDCYSAGEIWNMIIENAHATGEPGIIFIDRINADNPTPALGRIECCNPCGEQPLLSYEACNLGSINISKFVTEDGTDMDWDLLAETIRLCVRFLDNVVDVNYWPVPEIEKVSTGNRKIGLGIMGFADALILSGIRYDSQKAVEFAKKLAAFLQKHAHQTSEELAKKRGCFPNFKSSVWDTKYNRPMRNAAVTTIAPTGSISRIAGCSSGIEPLFELAKIKTQDGREFIKIHRLIEGLGTEDGWLSEKVRNLLGRGISPKDIPRIPGKIAEALLTAHEVGFAWHVRIQAKFQKYTDNAVSKTVNLPSDTSVTDVDKIYRLACRLGCKGITVYRDNCRIDEEQVLPVPEKATHTPRPRPRKTKGQTTKFRMGCGTLFVTVNKDSKGLCEVFANLGKLGGCTSQSEAMCRAVSAALRCGVDPKVLVEQLKSIRCPSTIAKRKTNKNIDVLSCPDSIARAIEDALGEDCESVGISAVNRCPECDWPLRKEAGCSFCDNDDCWYFKCG